MSASRCAKEVAGTFGRSPGYGFGSSGCLQLTLRELADFARELANQRVLSVYVGRDSRDPGMRDAWRRRLDDLVLRARSGIDVRARAELEAFDRALEKIMHVLRPVGRILPTPGFVAFASAERLWHAGGLDYAPPELVRWRRGPFVGPYLRGVARNHPMILAIVNGRGARLFGYRDHMLFEELEIAAEHAPLDLSDHGPRSRAWPSSNIVGARGETRKDAIQRAREEAMSRFRRQVAEKLAAMAGTEGGVVLAGTEEATSALERRVDGRLRERTVRLPQTDGAAPSASDASSSLSALRQSKLLEACLDASPRRSTGWNATLRALRAGAVDTLLVSRRLIGSSPDGVEGLIRLALATGADVEELGDDPGRRLDAEAEGIGARLRFGGEG